MSGERCLIANADDFGLSEGTNRGIIEAHERGIVTSASLMVRQSAAVAAAEYARTHPNFSIGLHMDLCEWECRDGEWQQLYEFAAVNDENAVSLEIARQLEMFHELMRRAPTHLDSHQHVHQHEPVLRNAIVAAGKFGIPLRGVLGGIAFNGGFYGHGSNGTPYPEGITVENLIEILRQMPEGITELSCHPGRDDTLHSCYCAERLTETDTLCDPRIRRAMANERIVLRSFAEVGL